VDDVVDDEDDDDEDDDEDVEHCADDVLQVQVQIHDRHDLDNRYEVQISEVQGLFSIGLGFGLGLELVSWSSEILLYHEQHNRHTDHNHHEWCTYYVHQQ